MPEGPGLVSWPPFPLVVRQKEVCASRRRVLFCDGSPNGCKPVPHCCCKRAGHICESGSLIHTSRMLVLVSCGILAMDAPQEGTDEELPVKEPLCCHALGTVQVGSVQHPPDVSPRWWWSCSGSSRVGCVGYGDPLLGAGWWPKLKLQAVAPRQLPLRRRAYPGRKEDGSGSPRGGLPST